MANKDTSSTDEATMNEALRALVGEDVNTVAVALRNFYQRQRDEALAELEQAASMLREDPMANDVEYKRLANAHARAQQLGDRTRYHSDAIRTGKYPVQLARTT